MVANFSTIFHEVEARDGPVAIVSQSGANSQAIYTLLREKGLSARHVHATGNEADVTVADLAAAVAADPGVRLVLLYMEAIKNPAMLAAAARAAKERDVPIVALKAGRTVSGQRAASSHTGALATEDRVVDAFFERHGIWRANDPQALVSAAELYLSGRRPRGKPELPGAQLRGPVRCRLSGRRLYRVRRPGHRARHPGVGPLRD